MRYRGLHPVFEDRPHVMDQGPFMQTQDMVAWIQAIFGTQTFGSQTPPPPPPASSLLIHPWGRGACCALCTTFVQAQAA